MPDIVPTHRLTEQASLKMLAAGVRKADELDCKVSLGVAVQKSATFLLRVRIADF